MEEMMEGRTDEIYDVVLQIFAHAHLRRMGDFCTSGVGLHHALAFVGLQERRIELLHKMELFRDKGEAMCHLAGVLQILQRPQESKRCYERARDIAEAHGLFLLECMACEGLGELAIKEGRDEEGVELIRNALVYPKP
jgi:hypothetical protein